MYDPTRPGRSLRLRGALVAGLALALLSACAPSDGPVVLGFAGPLRTSYGESTRLGAELARREVNEQGGIGGRPLELRFLDDSADPDSALAVADSLYRDPTVVAVVGPVNSGTTVHAADIYQRGLPAVATSATSAEVSRLGDWIFRVASSDSANSVELARYARRLDLRTAILYENEDYGRGLAEGFRGAFADAGGRVVEADPYLPGTADLTPYLERMKRRGVQLVFVAGLEEDAARIMRDARRVGLDARFLGGDGVEGLARMGPQYDGAMVGLLFHPDASPAARAFTERFRAAFHREPDSFAALGYDATRLLARAATEAGPRRAAIRDWLSRVGRDAAHPAFAGATGEIRFDENGDPRDKGFAVGVVRDGEIVLGEEG